MLLFFFIKFCSICENSTARIRNNRANSGKLKTKQRQGFAFLVWAKSFTFLMVDLLQDTYINIVSSFFMYLNEAFT